MTRDRLMTLRVGDLILLNNKPRLIRNISLNNNKRSKYYEQPFYFHFLKQKRSQYPGCSTLYTLSELPSMGVKLLLRNVTLKGPNETAINYTIKHGLVGSRHGSPYGKHIRSAMKYNLYADNNLSKTSL